MQLKRSKHNLSHYRLTTFDQGYLVPVGCIEILMGDSIRHVASSMLRVAPLVSPLMHPVDVRIHHWFVPMRVIWDSWDEFITGQSTPTYPTVTYTNGVDDYELVDHLGLPDTTNTISALPFRAYNKIFNEFYRDQDLITEVAEDSLDLQRVSWEKDYFTSARPSAQQGSAVSIPFATGSRADVRGVGIDSGWSKTSGTIEETGGNTVTAANTDGNRYDSGVFARQDAADTDHPDIYADLSSTGLSGGVDVNDFRLSMAMQRHLEARNRYGSRIQDYLAYHGIRPRDGRLEIPEYLGGGKQTISFSEVLATAVDSGSNTDVGDMAGHGIAAIRTRPYGRFFSESGFMLSLMSVRPRTIYSEQIHKMWLRSSKDDFWQKEYEELGPQAVLKKEVYGAHGNSTDIFGYNGRHDEYRRHPSYVTGDFRNSTDYHWHYARILGSSPTLNQSFVECAPTDRVYADTSEPEIRAMVNHDIFAKRLVRKRPKH